MLNKYVIKSWVEIEIAEGKHKSVLHIVTNLETNPNSEDWNSSEFDDMLDSFDTTEEGASAHYHRKIVHPDNSA